MKEIEYPKGSIGWHIQLAEKCGYPEIKELKKTKAIGTWKKWAVEKGVLEESTYFYNFVKRSKINGFDNPTEYARYIMKQWRHDSGKLTMEENKECSKYFGEYIAERYIMELFEDSIPMPPNNPSYDWICKNGYKIQHKARCLEYRDERSPRWYYCMNYNSFADYFILSAWKDRESLEPIHVWAIHRDEIIRGAPFWMRNCISIIDSPESLEEFEKYELKDKLEKLKYKCLAKLG